MHVLVVFVDLGGIGLTCKPRQSFLENVYSQRLVTRDKHVNSEIKLMTIYQQRIGDVSANNRQFINIHVVDVVNQHDASSLGSVGGLNNPNVLFAIMLLQFLVVLIEFSKFIREDVSIWYKVKMLFSKSFLHSDNIEAKSVLPGDLMTLREMINFLVLIQALIEITLATG